ncbi:hypothetical protein SAMN05421766_105150 [Zobellia uliginosa]|uniref:Uncharacterized protein n=1 Tax=Zobellia uliginosa TaxID=143224 RepID=A0ABY1KYX4_9FLAO|nr:hypothetical protein [Zobellia uliginosa]SIS95112.1 hypothetical protein SAMN05421766_105150 [Zobellia uliginosa]
MAKYLYAYILFTFLFISCKENKKAEPSQPEKELTILEKIAYANGYKNWNKVEELKFTFNVDRDTAHFERSWIWKPKTNDVTAISANDTLTYNRKDMDSTAYKTNGGFINDKYWLIAPINILWDKNGSTNELSPKAEAPISKKSMQKLTVVYKQEGGYTPGDAYDFYFGDDYLIKEWVFRKGNQAEPSMITTWEDYSELGGLKIAKMHQNEDGSFKLYFTGLEVKTN